MVQGLWRNGLGQTDGRMDVRTDEPVTICSLFGEHDKQYKYCKNKLDSSKIVNIVYKKPGALFPMTVCQIGKRIYRLKKKIAHGETFNEHFNHEVSLKFDKNEWDISKN